MLDKVMSDKIDHRLKVNVNCSCAMRCQKSDMICVAWWYNLVFTNNNTFVSITKLSLLFRISFKLKLNNN